MIKPKKVFEYYFPKFYVELIKLKNCLKSRKVKSDITKNDNLIRIKNNKYKNTFFGYYDRTPFNQNDDNLLLFHANNHNPQKVASVNVKTDIVLYNMVDESIKKIGETRSWNWQQGSRLHWIDEEHFVYNWFDSENKSFKCKKVNIIDRTEVNYDFPVQDSYKNEFFLTLDYHTLSKTRPDYGYRNRVDKVRKEVKNSVFQINFETGLPVKLFEINDICNLLNLHINFKKSKARINHIMINPSGKCFVFLFRYYEKYELKHVLMLYDISDRKLKVLISNNMISHYCWENDKDLLFWGKINSFEDYFKLDTVTLDFSSLKTNLKDGHPWLLNKNFAISDTYPDHQRRRSLLKLNLNSGKYKTLISFFESCKFVGETRCDLHPHPSPSGKYIHMDTIDLNKRTLSILRIKS